MRIVVSAQGESLDAPTSPVFGRCPTYIFVDTDTMQFEAVTNPAMNQGGGAGIQAAQFVVERGAQAVLTGNLGPNAFGVLQAAGVPGYLIPEGTVRQAVEAFKANRLQPMGGANVAAHAGMGGGVGSGPGMAGGMGGGMGTGMGRGMGRGMGMSGGFQPAAPAQPAPQHAPEEELAQIRARLQELRQQLAETMDQIDRLEQQR
jgi:predicted Fe-Mo cluster-binding NifX family protein